MKDSIAIVREYFNLETHVDVECGLDFGAEDANGNRYDSKTYYFDGSEQDADKLQSLINRGDVVDWDGERVLLQERTYHDAESMAGKVHVVDGSGFWYSPEFDTTAPYSAVISSYAGGACFAITKFEHNQDGAIITVSETLTFDDVDSMTVDNLWALLAQYPTGAVVEIPEITEMMMSGDV